MFESLLSPGLASMHRNWHLRALKQAVCQALSFAPDPTPALLNPSSGHRTRAVRIPLGRLGMPGYFFVPDRANGATVLLLHGITAEDVAPYFLWIQALLRAGFQVLTFELDGHGGNPRSLAWPGIEENLPAAHAFVRSLPEVDRDRLGLVGVSLGGACVLHALGELDGIQAAAVVSTPHHVALNPLTIHLEALGTLNPELLPVCFQASAESMLSFLTRPIRLHGDRLVDFLDPRFEQPVHELIAYLDPLGAAGRAETPLLFMYGEWDQLAPAQQARELFARARGHKSLTLVPRRNHFTVMGSPEAIAGTVGWMRRWLAA